MKSNGIIKINNDNNIIMPSPGKINSYSIPIESPSFFIKNHYLIPLEKNYKINLPNPITIPKNNAIHIDIKIPKQLFTSQTNYEIINFDKVVNNLYSSLNFKASNLDLSTNIIYEPDNIFNQLIVYEYCGWYIIKLVYNNNDDLCNLCNINYSLCFDSFKLKVIKHKKERNFITFNNNIQTTLNIINCDLNIQLNNYDICDEEDLKVDPMITTTPNILGCRWTGPNSFIQENTKILNFTPVDTNIEGNYTLKVINEHYCITEKTIYIQVHELPKFTISGIESNGYCQDDIVNINIHPIDSTEFNPIRYEYNLYSLTDSNTIISGYGDSNDTTMDNLITFPIDTNLPENTYQIKIRIIDINNCEYIIWNNIIIHATPQFRLTGLDTNGYCQDDTNNIVLLVEPIGNDTSKFSPVRYNSYTLTDKNNTNLTYHNRIDTNDTNDVTIQLDTNLPEGVYDLVVEFIDENDCTYEVTEEIRIHAIPQFTIDQNDISQWNYDSSNRILVLNPDINDTTLHNIITYEYEIFGGDTNISDSTFTGDTNIPVDTNNGIYFNAGIYNSNGIVVDLSDTTIYPNGDYLIRLTLTDEEGCKVINEYELLNA